MTLPPYKTVELTLPFPPKELSPNARVFRLRKADKTRLFKGECLALSWQQLGRKPSAPLPSPVTAHTTFVVTTNRKRDEDNLSASIKALWDALVTLGLLEGDDAARLHHAPIAIEKGKEACVKVRLEAAS